MFKTLLKKVWFWLTVVILLLVAYIIFVPSGKGKVTIDETAPAGKVLTEADLKAHADQVLAQFKAEQAAEAAEQAAAAAEAKRVKDAAEAQAEAAKKVAEAEAKVVQLQKDLEDFMAQVKRDAAEAARKAAEAEAAEAAKKTEAAKAEKPKMDIKGIPSEFEIDPSELKGRFLGFDTKHKKGFKFPMIKNSKGNPTPCSPEFSAPVETDPDGEWVIEDYRLPNGVTVPAHAVKL